MARKREIRKFLKEETVNLTPLIDCVFLLLIFFMVTTAFLHTKGLDVDLPAKSESAEESQKKDINVVINSEGKMEIAGKPVEKENLQKEIKNACELYKNDNIIIQADREAAQVHVVDVVDAAKACGVKGIAFARLEEGAEE